MPTLEKYYARQQMRPFQAPYVPARQLSDTGEGLEARAMEGFGQTTEAIVTKWYEREGNTQYDTQRRIAREEFNKFALKEFNSADTHDSEYKKMREGLKRLIPKNRIGARKFRSWLDSASPYMDSEANEKKIRMIKFNNESEYIRNISAISTESDFEKAQTEARTLTQGAIDDRTRTTAQASSDYDKIMGEWLKADAWRRATSITRADGEIDWEQAAKWFDIPENVAGLPEDALEDLAETARTQASAQKRRDDEKLKEIQEQQRDEAYSLIESNDEGAIDAINGSVLPAKEKAALRKLVRNPDIKLNYPEYDRVVDIIDGVAKGTHTEEQADEAIKGGVGRYFDTAIAISLRSKLSGKKMAGGPLQRPAATRATTEIEEIMDAVVKWRTKHGTYIDEEGKTKDYGYKQESRDIQKKHRMKNDVDAWLLENPDATDEEIEKKVESVMRPVKEEIAKGLFGRFLEMMPKIFPLIGHRRKSTKPKTEAEFNDTVANIEDEDEAEKYYEKWKNEW